jgi:ELWxxDGT repeat protein
MFGSGVSYLKNVNGTLFFRACDTTSGCELWKSDGSETGTVLVKDILPGGDSSHPSSLTNVDGTLFFRASDGTSGIELWKSDGTDGGTVRVKDITPGSQPTTTFSSPSYLTNIGGTLFFRANDGMSGIELWKSDGTEAGTVPVRDIFPGAPGSYPRYLANLGGTLFFRARDAQHGYELWKSDGTEVGTFLVKDISTGIAESDPRFLTNVAGTLFFRALDMGGIELWKSDGTEGGTVRVKDIVPGPGFSNPQYLTNVAGTLFFRATDNAHGMELWQSDGTELGTMMVEDLIPGIRSSEPNNILGIDDRLFVSAFTPQYGRELWTGRLDCLAMIDGDFDNDGVYSSLDIDALFAVIVSGSHNPLYDLTCDQLVNLDDRDAWLAEAGAVNLGPGRVYRLGDANLDGLVDGSDFGTWNANKFTLVADWSKGDFNADGQVDGSDFGIWNANKFLSSAGVRPLLSAGSVAAPATGAVHGGLSQLIDSLTTKKRLRHVDLVYELRGLG